MSLAHVVARQQNGATVLAKARSTSPVRLVRPTFPGSRASAVCLVTFGGGLVDGDDIEVAIDVEPGAVLLVFTQASTKVFRGSSRQTLRASVQGTLVLAPDPVACFAGARYTQRIDVALHGAGSCVLLDGFTAGRAAYGERWAFDGIDLRTTVTREGRPVLRDALRLDAADGAIATRMAGYDAYATVTSLGVAPVTESILEATRLDADAAVAPSPLPSAPGEGAIARIAARTPARALAEARRCMRHLDRIGCPDPFASRS